MFFHSVSYKVRHDCFSYLFFFSAAFRILAPTMSTKNPSDWSAKTWSCSNFNGLGGLWAQVAGQPSVSKPELTAPSLSTFGPDEDCLKNFICSRRFFLFLTWWASLRDKHVDFSCAMLPKSSRPECLIESVLLAPDIELCKSMRQTASVIDRPVVDTFMPDLSCACALCYRWYMYTKGHRSSYSDLRCSWKEVSVLGVLSWYYHSWFYCWMLVEGLWHIWHKFSSHMKTSPGTAYRETQRKIR